MSTQSLQQTTADPWHGKGERYWLIASLVFVFSFVFAAYDGSGFYVHYLKLCSEQPGRADCRPLSLVKEERRPDLGITLDYGKGKWALEVGMRQEGAQANDLTSQLRSYGIEPRIIKIRGKGKSTWYQVQVGRFPTSKSASEAGIQLQRKGLTKDFKVVDYQAMK
jgi:hypothetical protein